MRSLFEYINYRQYLAEYYAAKKAESSCFSYRYFCRKSGVKSPVFLKQVIDGKRNLTAPMIRRFCRGLELDRRQARYFGALVRFNQAKTASDKQEHYAILRGMMNTMPEALVPPGLYDYFSTWYNPVVRELLCMTGFDGSPARIAAALIPPITETQARGAIAFLLRSGLVERRSDGTYAQRDPALATDDEVVSLALRAFNARMVELARAAIERVPLAERHVSGVTLSCSPELYSVIAAEIAAFKQHIVTLANRDTASHDRVYQLNLQLFPLSRGAKERPSGAKEGAA